MKNELLTLKNVGPATYEDLCKLGITSIEQLAQADPDELYLRLQKITKKIHDPCVWDVFAAIIHEAKTGEKQPWWHWTPIRKSRQMLKSWESDVVIGKGDLHGKGIYANRDFKKDEIVIKYHLKPLTKQQYDKLLEKEKLFAHVHRGVIQLYSEPERYVNHSAEPNTYHDYTNLNNQADIALRNIKKGEMITCDAAKDDVF